MLIFEGPENVGKTTVAKTAAHMIALKTGVPMELCYGHMTRPPEDFNEWIHYAQVLGGRAQDRFHVGALAYGILMGVHRNLPSYEFDKIVRFLQWRGCYVVCLYDSDMLKHATRLRDKDRAQMYGNEGSLKVAQIYKQLVTLSQGKPDWEGHNHPVTLLQKDEKTGWPDVADELEREGAYDDTLRGLFDVCHDVSALSYPDQTTIARWVYEWWARWSGAPQFEVPLSHAEWTSQGGRDECEAAARVELQRLMVEKVQKTKDRARVALPTAAHMKKMDELLDELEPSVLHQTLRRIEDDRQAVAGNSVVRDIIGGPVSLGL